MISWQLGEALESIGALGFDGLGGAGGAGECRWRSGCLVGVKALTGLGAWWAVCSITSVEFRQKVVFVGKNAAEREKPSSLLGIL